MLLHRLQYYIITMSQYYDATMFQWYLLQWFNVTMLHCYNGTMRSFLVNYTCDLGNYLFTGHYSSCLQLHWTLNIGHFEVTNLPIPLHRTLLLNNLDGDWILFALLSLVNPAFQIHYDKSVWEIEKECSWTIKKGAKLFKCF